MKRYIAQRQAQLLQQLIRMIYLFGCTSKAELRKLLGLNTSTADKEFSALADLLELENEAAGGLSVQTNWLEGKTGHLLDVYLGQAPVQRDYNLFARYVHITAYLHKNNTASFTELRTKSGAMDPMRADALRKVLPRFEAMGLLECHTGVNGQANTYSLVQPFWEKLTDAEKLCVQRFVEWAAVHCWPSYDGFTLLAKLEQVTGSAQRVFRSDHRHHAVLDEDVLYQLEPHLGTHWVELELMVRDKRQTVTVQNIVDVHTVTVFPCRILHEQEYGRSWVICIPAEPAAAPVSIPVSLIVRFKKAVAGSAPQNWQQLCDSALEHVFLAGLTRNDAEPLAFTIQFAAQAVGRVQREGVTAARNGTIESCEDGSILYRIVVADGTELRPWLRSFGAQAKIVQVIGAQTETDYTPEYRLEMHETWQEMKNRYAPQ